MFHPTRGLPRFNHERHALFAAFLVAASLSGCSGGGNGAATEAPVSAISFSGPLSAMTAEVTFNASRAGVDTCRNDAVVVCTTRSEIRGRTIPGHQVEIDPVARTVKIAPAFGKTDVTFSGVDYTTGVTTFQTVVQSPVLAIETLKILLPGTAASNLDWASYGVWSSIQVNPLTGGEFFTGEALSFGVLTPLTDMPTTGGATYNGFMDGFYVNAAKESFGIRGNADMTATFNTGVISGQFNTIVTTPISAGVPAPGVPFGDINFSASISGNNFSGSASSSGISAPMNGTVQGSFYGPAAVEAGGVFRITGGGEHAVGGFAVRQ